tara:strand:+ start:252 stop:515 length:264 start_codon:yes stop_codon:yes gene_type:complete
MTRTKDRRPAARPTEAWAQGDIITGMVRKLSAYVGGAVGEAVGAEVVIGEAVGAEVANARFDRRERCIAIGELAARHGWLQFRKQRS